MICNRHILIPILILMSIFSVQCTKEISDFPEYMKYLSDVENGLVKKKEIAGISLQVKYLPVDYQVYVDAYKTNKNITNEQVQELREDYKNSTTFMLTLGPEKGQGFDITRVNLETYEEYAARLDEMNFNMKDFVHLKVGEEIIKPDLAQMESLYGLEKKRDILFVFNTQKLKPNEDIQFVYKDKLFNTGINIFRFQNKDLAALPSFIFKK